MTQAPSAPGMPVFRPNPFDPPPALVEWRDEGPVRPFTFPDGHEGWIVTRYATARAVLADPRFSARQDLRHVPMDHPLAKEPPEPAAPGNFIRMDPPDHTKYRRLLTGQFTVRRMKQLEPRIQEVADGLLDEMAAAGPPADLVSAYALAIPSFVICELLGVPYADREKFQSDSSTMLGLTGTIEDVKAAVESIYGYLTGLVTDKIESPTDDILGGLAAGGELDAQELTMIGLLLLIAGHETTANMLGLGTLALLRHPDQLAKLVAEPELLNGAVEELMRYLSIIQSGPVRAALEDVELDGVTVKVGENVVIATPIVNRDPERFDDPDRLDLTRNAASHIGFGHGLHQCLGQQLARVEMRIGYASLFRRFPTLTLAVPAEEVPLRHDMVIYGVHSLPVTW